MLSNIVNVAVPTLAAAPAPALEPETGGGGGNGQTGGEATALAAAPAAPAQPRQAVPAFITPASLVTVSGGTTAVTLVWQIAKLLLGKPAQSPWVPFLISLAVGAVIYLLSIGDEKVKASRNDKIVGLFIGFLNSMVLFAAAMGILGKQ